MITKERLEELIEQGATIYGIDDRWDIVEVRELDAQQIYYSSSNVNYQYVFDDHSVVEFFDDKLFETKADAEEYAEFGNITRTERLPYMNWDEFNAKECFEFTSKSGEPFVLEKTLIIDFESEGFTNYELNIFNRNDFDHISLFNAECNRENYHQALRLCVKLFKGEEL